MRPIVLGQLSLVVMLIGVTDCRPGPRVAGIAAEREPPLRLSDPLDAVVSDLEAYIPVRMRDAGVPGLSIALIRGGRTVWTEGFGVGNTVTRESVTPRTVFDVASISKVATAYTALRLVEQGKLALDEPVASYLAQAWLPPSEHGDSITLRHLLTHTSGLTNKLGPLDRSVVFPPGQAYSYSGVGFVYLQEVIQQATGRSLEDVAEELTFEPLGMASSSYASGAGIRARVASGHMSYGPLLAAVAVPFAVVLFVFSLLGVVIGRVRSGRWALSWRMLAAGSAVALGVVLVAAMLLLGRGAARYGVLALLCLILIGIVLVGLALAGRATMRHIPGLRGKRRQQNALTGVWIAISVIATFWVAGRLVGPVPKEPAMPANAAYSLRATAPDLAALLIEIADPHVLNPSLGQQMRAPHVSANADNSWGLGLGVQHSLAGDSVWHTGDNPDFKSLMVMYPEHRLGVVVLTNGEGGMPVAHDVAQRALGGKAEWRNRP